MYSLQHFRMYVPSARTMFETVCICEVPANKRITFVEIEADVLSYSGTCTCALLKFYNKRASSSAQLIASTCDVQRTENNELKETMYRYAAAAVFGYPQVL